MSEITAIEDAKLRRVHEAYRAARARLQVTVVNREQAESAYQIALLNERKAAAEVERAVRGTPP